MTETLIVEVPGGYEEERRWIADVLLGEFLGIDCHTISSAGDDVRIVRAAAPDGRGLSMPDVLFQTPIDAWLTPEALPAEPIQRWDVAGELPRVDIRDLPVLYARDGESGGRLSDNPDGLHLDCDLFGAAFVMLTRYEECVPGPRDQHGRMRAQDSLAWRNGFLERPVVNEYVDVLFALLSKMWPGLPRRSWTYEVRPTHDVDFPLVTKGRGPMGIAKRIGGDVAVRRSPELALRTARASNRRGASWFRRDPAYTFDFLMDVSESRGLESSFYFICDRTDPDFDGDYELDDPWIITLMQSIHERGHRIGLHPSYETWMDPPQIAREFRALRTATDRLGIHQERWGGRQHYLRWQNPVTWRAWSDAGLDYDCTLGFADHVGFRCGVCYPFRAFDLLERRPLRLIERPMHVMDRTLTEYMGLSESESVESAARLAAATRHHGGEFQVLWHNTELLTRAQQRHYGYLMEAVT